MAIELKQNLFHIMGILFHDTRQYLDAEFKKYDLSRNEWLIFALLRFREKGVSQAFAKAYLGIEPSYFTKVLNSLENKGFILRDIDPNDRRNRIIKINPKNNKKIKKIFKTIYDFNEDIQSDLSDGQIKALHKSLSVISKKLNEIKFNSEN